MEIKLKVILLKLEVLFSHLMWKKYISMQGLYMILCNDYVNVIILVFHLLPDFPSLSHVWGLLVL